MLGTEASSEDAMKLSFTLQVSLVVPDIRLPHILILLQALEKNPFVRETEPPNDMKAALHWQAARSPQEVNREREQIVIALEEAGAYS